MFVMWSIFDDIRDLFNGQKVQLYQQLIMPTYDIPTLQDDLMVVNQRAVITNRRSNQFFTSAIFPDNQTRITEILASPLLANKFYACNRITSLRTMTNIRASQTIINPNQNRRDDGEDQVQNAVHEKEEAMRNIAATFPDELIAEREDDDVRIFFLPIKGGTDIDLGN